jgi:fructose-bisphosphate aldolase class 1
VLRFYNTFGAFSKQISGFMGSLSRPQLAALQKQYKQEFTSKKVSRRPYFYPSLNPEELEMDLNKTEMNVVEEATKQAIEAQMNELSDLQLAYVGGGIGETAV